MLIQGMVEGRVAEPLRELMRVRWKSFLRYVIRRFHAPKHVIFPRPLENSHQSAGKRVELIGKRYVHRESHMLLIENCQRAMKLVTRIVFDPRCCLSVGCAF